MGAPRGPSLRYSCLRPNGADETSQGLQPLDHFRPYGAALESAAPLGRNAIMT